MKAQKRDLSYAQFKAQCARLGFKPQGFMGYYDLGIPGYTTCSSVFNAGDRRRDQLAYLIAQRKREVEHRALKTAAKVIAAVRLPA